MTPLQTSASSDIERVRRIYRIIAIGCGMFVILTLIAMLTYAGGAIDDHFARGYSFTHNFLSNLGMVTALSGEPNWISAILFFVALSAAGLCLVIFFILFQRFFKRNRIQRILAVTGSAFGVLAGINFVGIAFTPADVSRGAHIFFVMWAFRLFPLAVLLYIPVLFMDQRYPKAYAWVFALFGLMLVGYYLLMTYGPDYGTPQGLVIQVVGQKVIAYASILSIGIESLGADQFLSRWGSKS